MRKPANIALFASGNGSNAENLALYFQSHPRARISLLISNKSSAGVIGKMKKLGIPCFVFSNNQIEEGAALVDLLKKNQIELILLAGFLRKIPHSILEQYRDAILNIHPSLLPKHGGRGMYGLNVHRQVIESGDNESGATVHFVDENYDKGKIISAARCPVFPGDSPETLSARVLNIEHQIFPLAVEAFLAQNQNHP